MIVVPDRVQLDDPSSDSASTLKYRAVNSNGVKNILLQWLLACSHVPPSNKMTVGA